MKKSKAEMFNRKAAGIHSQPDRVIESVNVKPGDTVLDLGAGGGYYAIRLGTCVTGSGQVYAADVNENMLEYIGQYAQTLGMHHIEPIKTNGGVPDVPKKSIDLVFVRNVYHHIDNPALFFMALSDKLRHNGRVVIIEYKKEKRFSLSGVWGHATEEDTIQSAMENAGYRLETRYDFLKKQSFGIYVQREE